MLNFDNIASHLHQAAFENCVRTITQLHQQGQDIDSRNDREETPLHIAAKFGSTEAAEKLLTLGANIEAMDADGASPLHKASQFGHTASMLVLLGQGASPGARNYEGSTPLHLASRYGRVGSVDALLARNADVGARNQVQETPIFEAAFNGYASVITSLVTRGADVNAQNTARMTPLHQAAARGKTECIQTLADSGANLDPVDILNQTPLHKASEAEKTDAVILLVELGARTRNVTLRNEHLIYIRGQDIYLEHKSIKQHLEGHSMNLVVLDEHNEPIMANVDTLQDHMQDAIVYACNAATGNINPDNVDDSVELFNPGRLNYTSGGYITNDSLREAMRLTVLQNRRLFRLSGIERDVPSVVSHRLYELHDNSIGGSHCQPGRDGGVRRLFVLDVPNIPVVPFPAGINNFLANSHQVFIKVCEMIRRCAHSGQPSRAAAIVGPRIQDAFQVAFPLMPPNSFVSDVAHRRLVLITYYIEDNDFAIFNYLCRIFYPSIFSVHIEAGRDRQKDWSFLSDITDLREFYGCRSYTRSVLRHLVKHSHTLTTLSLHIETPLRDSEFSNYPNLTTLHLINFRNDHRVLDSLRGSPALRELSLRSNYFSGSLNLLTECAQTLQRLTIKLPSFVDHTVAPLAELTNLRELHVVLPQFQGDFTALSVLTELRSLKLVSRSDTVPNIAGMTNLGTLQLRRV